MSRLRWALVALAACRHEPPPVEQRVTLGGDAVARVADDVIRAPLVASVAAAQTTDPRSAALALIEDALAAQGARAKGLDGDPFVNWSITSAHARVVVDRLRAEALAAGPPTDAEVNELTERYWRKFALPERVTVVHVVARFADKRTPETDQRAKQVGDDFAKALAGATDADDFEKRAAAVPHEGVRTEVARYCFVADGRSVDSPDIFDPVFVGAAFTLQKPGAQTRIETQFGFHILQLVDRLPPQMTPFEERRQIFTEEIQAMRARKAYDALLAKLRQAHAVEVSPAAENLMKSISAPPPHEP